MEDKQTASQWLQQAIVLCKQASVKVFRMENEILGQIQFICKNLQCPSLFPHTSYTMYAYMYAILSLQTFFSVDHTKRDSMYFKTLHLQQKTSMQPSTAKDCRGAYPSRPLASRLHTSPQGDWLQLQYGHLVRVCGQLAWCNIEQVVTAWRWLMWTSLGKSFSFLCKLLIRTSGVAETSKGSSCQKPYSNLMFGKRKLLIVHVRAALFFYFEASFEVHAACYMPHQLWSPVRPAIFL